MNAFCTEELLFLMTLQNQAVLDVLLQIYFVIDFYILSTIIIIKLLNQMHT